MYTFLITLFTSFGILAGIYYYCTQNILFTVLFAGTAAILSLLLTFYGYKKYILKSKNFNECLLFIEKYIISVNTRKSLIGSFEDTYSFLEKCKVDELSSADANLKSKLEVLDKYYNFEIYKLFKQIICEYEVTGGNIIEVCEQLLIEVSSLKSDQKFYNSSSIHNLVSFIVIWIFAFAVVIGSKLALSNFMANVYEDFIFQILIFVGFMVFLLSIAIYSVKVFSLSYIKGVKHEKI